MIPNRIVLDTNVCLDLFVFCDPRWHRLLHALEDGALDAVTRSDCRTEWQIVLGYAHLRLDAAARARCADQFDRLIRCIEPTDTGLESGAGGAAAFDQLRSAAAVKLPLCRDPDDQKFLELARDSRAATLLTKDKALLKLAGKIRRAGLFAILPPDAWQPAQSETTLCHLPTTT
ncbi:MAG: PIN domain-containing protein [Pseudomonadota bacterium]|nr:PIN domain-containing protein [Pseudomonadota bacterium]